MLLNLNNERMKSLIPAAILAVISYITHIVGIITLTVSITIGNTFEYRLATKYDGSDVQKILSKFGYEIDLSNELQKLTTCRIVGIVTLSVAVVTLIVCIILAVHTARTNVDIINRKIKRDIYSESKNAVNEEKRLRDRTEIGCNNSFSTQSVHSQSYEPNRAPGYGKNGDFSGRQAFSSPREANRSYGYGKNGGTLFCTGGLYEGASFSVRNCEEIVIGNDPSICNIVLGDAYSGISRLHLSLRLSEDGMFYYITDYSLNGTYAFGKRLTRGEQTALALGTIITLGNGPESFRLE